MHLTAFLIYYYMNIKDIKLKFKNRATMAFERLTGKMFELRTNSDLLIYYYAVVISSAPEIKLTFDEFIDILDNDDSVAEYINKEYADYVKSRIDNTPQEAVADGKK